MAQAAGQHLVLAVGQALGRSVPEHGHGVEDPGQFAGGLVHKVQLQVRERRDHRGPVLVPYRIVQHEFREGVRFHLLEVLEQFGLLGVAEDLHVPGPPRCGSRRLR